MWLLTSCMQLSTDFTFQVTSAQTRLDKLQKLEQLGKVLKNDVVKERECVTYVLSFVYRPSPNFTLHSGRLQTAEEHIQTAKKTRRSAERARKSMEDARVRPRPCTRKIASESVSGPGDTGHIHPWYRRVVRYR